MIFFLIQYSFTCKNFADENCTFNHLGMVVAIFPQVGRLSMNKQLEYFANTKAQILAMIGEAAGMDLIHKALYSANMGSNDYVNNYYMPLSPIANYTSTQVANLLVSTYHGQLTVRTTLIRRRTSLVASLILGKNIWAQFLSSFPAACLHV